MELFKEQSIRRNRIFFFFFHARYAMQHVLVNLSASSSFFFSFLNVFFMLLFPFLLTFFFQTNKYVLLGDTDSSNLVPSPAYRQIAVRSSVGTDKVGLNTRYSG